MDLTVTQLVHLNRLESVTAWPALSERIRRASRHMRLVPEPLLVVIDRWPIDEGDCPGKFSPAGRSPSGTKYPPPCDADAC